MLNKIIKKNLLISLMYITALSFGINDNLPTSMPTTLPTSMPSFMNINEPTGYPTIEPTGFPTIEPTRFPTIEPSIKPTIEPSIKPSLEPTFNPSLEPTFIDIPIGSTVISFPVSVGYSGITLSLWNENINENNDIACTATTKILNIPKSGCQVTGLVENQFRRFLIDYPMRKLSNIGVIVTTQLTVPIKNNESNSTYNMLTNKLQQSVDDGSFTSSVVNSAVESGSIILQSVVVPVQIIIVEPYIELAYTSSPSSQPSEQPIIIKKDKNINLLEKPGFIAMYVCIFIFVCIVLSIARQIRAKRIEKQKFVINTLLNDMSNKIITKLENTLETTNEDKDNHFEIVLFENTAEL